ncbi:GyrI-like domain-containing protein [Iodobacter sp.]|uniref:GyrI-like domain-containing protein n=1 Tax=Iodobacter sp. TaxID=1915058 RepID=UPI0025FF63DA|nr:GyrI-like domain-containing protein [Iodobacter sp.]
MKKLDLKKELKHLYQPSAKEVVEVDVPSFNYLMIDGKGDPSTSIAYSQAVEALFSVAYTAKFMLKKGPQALDYAVMPLEGLWWAEDMADFIARNKAQWQWTMMIMQPAFLEKALITAAIAEVQKKKNLPGLPLLRFESFTEGRCAQILHIGPFDQEGPTIERLHDFIDSRASRAGKHHEIYLSDIRRANPQNWKTIIRHPIANHSEPSSLFLAK